MAARVSCSVLRRARPARFGRGGEMRADLGGAPGRGEERREGLGFGGVLPWPELEKSATAMEKLRRENLRVLGREIEGRKRGKREGVVEFK